MGIISFPIQACRRRLVPPFLLPISSRHRRTKTNRFAPGRFPFSSRCPRPRLTSAMAVRRPENRSLCVGAMAIPPHAKFAGGRFHDRQWIAAATIPNVKLNHAIEFFRKERDERRVIDCAIDFAAHKNPAPSAIPAVRYGANTSGRCGRNARQPTNAVSAACRLPMAARAASAALSARPGPPPERPKRRSRKLCVQRRMGNLCADCDEPAQGASRWPPCARRSWTRSGDYRGMLVFEPQFTIIEFAAGKDRGNPHSGLPRHLLDTMN